MLYAECKPDVLLVRLLTGVPKRGAVHELKGKYELCKRLGKGTNCSAMIDEEPWGHQPAYIKNLTAKDLPEHDLRVLLDHPRSNQVVVLLPNLEQWVLKGARVAEIDVRRYGLPDNWRELHHVIDLRQDGFDRLVADLKATPRFKALARLLRGPAGGSRGRKAG